MKTVRTNGNTSAPTYGANMLTTDTPNTTKAGFNINSSGQPEVWDVNGTAGKPYRLLYANSAASSAFTAAVEALFDTQYTLPANSLKAGSVLKIRFQGIAPTTDATDTLRIKLYIGGLGGTALLTGTATDVANNAIFAGEFTLICRTSGASGTFVGYGTHTEAPAASGTAVHDITEVLGSTAIDTTAAQVVGVGAVWSDGTGNSCRLDLLTVEMAA